MKAERWKIPPRNDLQTTSHEAYVEAEITADHSGTQNLALILLVRQAVGLRDMYALVRRTGSLGRNPEDPLQFFTTSKTFQKEQLRLAEVEGLGLMESRVGGSL